MANGNTVMVVGTGTIGEPLTGLLSDKNISKDLGIDELVFYKHSPRLTDRPMIKGLLSKGAHMAAQREKFDAFRELGVEPTYTFEDALAKSKVVVDCSSEGMGVRNKLLFYENEDSVSAFLAQGSEHGFGLPYGVGLNDDVLKNRNNRFIQVVSCNTHNASRILKNLAFDKNGKNKLSEGRFVFMRRATDVSQSGKFIAGPSVGSHKDSTFGTHHAKDVYRLYSTLGYHLNVFSSAIKLNTQYMHVASFHLVLDNHDCDCDLEDVKRIFREDPYVAVTNKTDANVIFSFGREYGHFGRILNQTVVVLPSLLVRKSNLFTDKVEVVGYSYTPQDGNSLLSSTSAVAYFLNPEEVVLGEPLPCLRPFIFTEV